MTNRQVAAALRDIANLRSRIGSLYDACELLRGCGEHDLANAVSEKWVAAADAAKEMERALIQAAGSND